MDTITAAAALPHTCRPVGDLTLVVSAAAMPSRCWGTYYHVAVVETEPGVRARAIDTRRRGTRQIVWVARKLSGRTSGPRTALARAKREAAAMIASLCASCEGAAP